MLFRSRLIGLCTC